MFKSDLPNWFKTWWIVNICLACIFIVYWFSVDFKSNYILFGFIIYSNIWGLWATRYRRKKS